MISEPGLDTGGILRFEFDGLGGVGREHQAVHQFACGAQDIGADNLTILYVADNCHFTAWMLDGQIACLTGFANGDPIRDGAFCEAGCRDADSTKHTNGLVTGMGNERARVDRAAVCWG